eukprot:TRINITY_DN368_c0_g1_i1.p1 TRINITY_DN368_c0_g1~~TRINITY_DN368_c0_g1_i1.p1  ORF type:complete len:122 (+),score=16.83 TRINITY_DN368_c0_g1_i1:278-643(+)
MWDTAGQERFRSMTPFYYRDADAAVLVYDITNATSYQELKHWYQELKEKEPDCTVFIVGNKLDLQEKRVITSHDAEKFATERRCEYSETSSKTNQGIEAIRQKIVDGLIKKEPKKGTSEPV